MKELCCVPSSSKLTFASTEAEDLGVYSVSVTDTDGVSSSYSVNEEGQRSGLHFSFFIYL